MTKADKEFIADILETAAEEVWNHDSMWYDEAQARKMEKLAAELRK